MKGPARTYVGLNLGYTRRLAKKFTLDVRVSVSNIFDEDGFEPISADGVTGVITGVRPLTPRTWSLATSVKF